MLIFFHSLFLAFLREAFTLLFYFFWTKFFHFICFLTRIFPFLLWINIKTGDIGFLTRGILEYLHNFDIHFCKPAFSVFDLCWKRVPFWSRKFSFVSGKRDFMSSDTTKGSFQLMLFLLQIISVAGKLTLILMFIYIL